MSVGLVRLPGLLASCLVLAACATSATAEGGDQPLPSATYAGAITDRAEYADGGIILEVPPASARARASWSQAYVTNCESGEAICVVGQRPNGHAPGGGDMGVPDVAVSSPAGGGGGRA